MVALFMGLFNNLSELVNKLVIFVGTFQQMHNQVQWVTHKLPVIDNFVGIKSLITQTTNFGTFQRARVNCQNLQFWWYFSKLLYNSRGSIVKACILIETLLLIYYYQVAPNHNKVIPDNIQALPLLPPPWPVHLGMIKNQDNTVQELGDHEEDDVQGGDHGEQGGEQQYPQVE